GWRVGEEEGGAWGAGGLLVRDGGRLEASRQPVAMLVEESVSHEAGDGTTLHIGGAATIETTIVDRAAPGSAVTPQLITTGRKHVNVAIEHQMQPGPLGIGGSGQVREVGHRRAHPVREAA